MPAFRSEISPRTGSSMFDVCIYVPKSNELCLFGPANTVIAHCLRTVASRRLPARYVLVLCFSKKIRKIPEKISRIPAPREKKRQSISLSALSDESVGACYGVSFDDTRRALARRRPFAVEGGRQPSAWKFGDEKKTRPRIISKESSPSATRARYRYMYMYLGPRNS